MCRGKAKYTGGGEKSLKGRTFKDQEGMIRGRKGIGTVRWEFVHQNHSGTKIRYLRKGTIRP